MDRHVPVSLLEPVVLLDVVQVVAADDDGARHFGGDDKAPAQQKTIKHARSASLYNY